MSGFQECPCPALPSVPSPAAAGPPSPDPAAWRAWAGTAAKERRRSVARKRSRAALSHGRGLRRDFITFNLRPSSSTTNGGTKGGGRSFEFPSYHSLRVLKNANLCEFLWSCAKSEWTEWKLGNFTTITSKHEYFPPLSRDCGGEGERPLL